MSEELIRFELVDDLTGLIGQKAIALLARPDIDGVVDGEDGHELTVTDAFGRFWARGGGGNLRGAMGYAAPMADSGDYEIVNVENFVTVGKVLTVSPQDDLATVQLWFSNKETGKMEKSPYNVTAKFWSERQLRDLEPGVRVSLRYDPQNRTWFLL